jgi:hypothetical protein
MLAGLAPLWGVRWGGRLLGPVLSVAKLRPALARLYVYDDAPIVIKFSKASLTRV